MNRPFGAVDVSANLKNAVPKAATQKILVSLAERGELTQKLYGAISRIWLCRFWAFKTGKTIFFVANQTNLECLSPDRIAELEIEYKAIDDTNKRRANEMRSALNGTHTGLCLVTSKFSRLFQSSTNWKAPSPTTKSAYSFGQPKKL